MPSPFTRGMDAIRVLFFPFPTGPLPMRAMPSNGRFAPRFLPLSAGVHFALAVAGLDLLTNLYHRPPGLGWPAYGLVPAGCAAVLALAAFLAVWGILRGTTGLLRAGAGGGTAALAVALGVPFLAIEAGEAAPFIYADFLKLLFPANLAVAVIGHLTWKFGRPAQRQTQFTFLALTALAYAAAMAHLAGWFYLTKIEAVWNDETARRVERALNFAGFTTFSLGLCAFSTFLGERLGEKTWIRRLAPRVLVPLPPVLLAAGLWLWRAAAIGGEGYPAQANLFISMLALVAVLTTAAALIRPSLTTLHFSMGLTLGLIGAGAMSLGWDGLSDRMGFGLPPARNPEVKRIILVTSDALRTDVLEPYGGEEIETPHLAAFAEESVVFDEAISAASWTLPAFAGIFSGFAPGVFDSIGVYWRMPETVESMAERLQKQGYFTGAIGTNPLLRPRHGLDQGFRTYDFFPRPRKPRTLGARVVDGMAPALYQTGRNSEELKDLTVDWIERNRDRDFFLWLHFWDPHTPLGPPPPYRPEGDAPGSVVEPWARDMEVKKGLYDPRPAERDWLWKLYLGEVRYVDAMFGRLMDRLKELGLYEDSLIIFSSDHGEEFWDHGDFGHGQSLFHELIRVPLMIRMPGGTRSGRVGRPVSTISLMPTILQMAEAGFDPNEFSAPSLVPLLEGDGEEIETRPIYSETDPAVFARHRWGVRFGDYEYLKREFGPEGGTEELYDLPEDPQQHHDVAAERPEPVARGRERLADYHEANEQMRRRHEIDEAEDVDLPTEDLEQLRKLGYI